MGEIARRGWNEEWVCLCKPTHFNSGSHVYALKGILIATFEFQNVTYGWRYSGRLYLHVKVQMGPTPHIHPTVGSVRLSHIVYVHQQSTERKEFPLKDGHLFVYRMGGVKGGAYEEG